MTEAADCQNNPTALMPSRRSWPSGIRLGLLCLLLSLLAPPAVAEDLIASRAYLLDYRGTMSYEQVQAAKFTPAGKVVSLGFIRSVLWLRLTVNQPTHIVPLSLGVTPASLDEVTLFLPRQSDSGSPTPLALTARNRWRHDWLPDAVGEQVYYLRIRATGAMTLLAVIESDTQSPETNIRDNITLGALLGALISTMLGCAILYFMHRDLIVLVGIFCTISAMLQILFQHGYLQRIIEHDSWLGSNAFFHMTTIANLLFGLFFLYLLLLRGPLPQWGARLSAALIAPVLAMPLVYVLFDKQFALQASCIIACISSTVMFLQALRCQIRRSRPIVYCLLVMALSAVLFKISATALGLSGNASDWAYSISVWRILGAPLVFATLLTILEVEKRNALRNTQANEQRTRQALLVLSGRRDIQERFVTTLMHEIKTPLSTIQLATASLGRSKLPVDADNPRLKNIRHSIDDLNTIVERYMQIDQFEQGRANIEKSSFEVGALVRELLLSIDNERIDPIGARESRIHSDFQSMRVILLNLLSNALKYSPPKSTVSLKCEPALQQGVPGIRISVSNALGVAGPPDPTQIFSRYYRSEGARRMAGAGLGLWLAQETARSIDTELRYTFFEDMITFDFWMALA